MPFRNAIGGRILVGIVLIGVAAGLMVGFYPEWVGLRPHSDQQLIWLLGIVATTFVVVLLVGGYHLWGSSRGRLAFLRREPDDVRQSGPDEDPQSPLWMDLKGDLRDHHGLFWRRKIRLLLVVGEPAEIDAIAPGLRGQLWLEGQGTVLLWGGSVQADGPLLTQWRGLSRWRALDGVVWALNKAQSLDATSMSAGVRRLQGVARAVHWQLPLYLWQVCVSEWPQPKRATQPVGCRLPDRFTLEQLEQSLGALQQPLRQQGWTQVQDALGHDFLLRLSRDLQAEGIARWRQALAPLLGAFARGVPLRGLWFSLPCYQPASGLPHHWPQDPAWHGLLSDKPAIRRLGWSTPRVGYALLLGLAALWGAGLLLSFFSNRAQIAQVQTSLATLQQPEQGDQQLKALNELMRELARLDYRAVHGVPWYQRFGLNQNPELLKTLWPRYVEANNQLMRDPAAKHLQQQLGALIKLAPGSAERASRARDAYDSLKAYLMMARPEKADAVFLSKVLRSAEPLRAGFSPGVWQGFSPNLWAFYAEHLAAHPDWRIEADPALVAQARQVLLGQLGQRNGDANLYQKVLDTAAHHYPALNLQQMVGDTDALALFSTDAQVPGIYTRQAWEGQVRQAIEEVAQGRREEIDWVLSDKPGDIDADMTPDVLRERLTERYFQDYSSAWLAFLNSVRWHQTDSLADVIDQLTLMSDVRQSPVIALMNTLAYQGQAGTRNQALADSLMKSAKKLIEQDNVPQIEQIVQGPSSPLDATFGPLLALLGKDSEGKGDNDGLSLQAFLNRVTRVRLKLQQVSNAPDPQAMTQALAQTVFQGKSEDLTDTQSYGRLIAASLGAEWGSVGQTLFVQPLEQAWQRVLQPSAAGLNKQWQRAIVSDWQNAFTGRYPFALTASDASLPMLGQMIRSDSGRIEQFLQRQLSGVLRKEGSRWVADTRHGQGLRINPQFLDAINQLSHLADVLYTDGGMGLSFELQGKPVRNVVQTTFTLNGETHQYFNQKESWQRFGWPGRSDYPGASLSWISVAASERLFGDFQGTWGLIRLLERAQITPLDDSDSRYRMVLKAPDGLELTWHLRTELGAGPMALLQLQGFTLPAQIFVGDGAEPDTQHGRFE
ncbi:ImcF-related family protein [Pseudomonas sp. SIMBA_077]